MNISISFTREEMNEMRFILKRYMKFYPYMPNEYFHQMRAGLIQKFTDAIERWYDTHPDTDCTCVQCKHWLQRGSHGCPNGWCEKHNEYQHALSNACNDFEWVSRGTINLKK